MRKIFMCIAAALTFVTTGAAALAEDAGFASESGVVNAKTPYDKNYVRILWNTPETETAGVPVADAESLYVPALNKVNKLAQEDGALTGSVEFDEKVSETCGGALLNGILVQPTRTKLFAVGVGDMTVLCSEKFGEIITDVALKDDLAYFGVRTENGSKFVCADVSDGLKTVWEYEAAGTVTAPALFGEYVVFGAGENLTAYRFDGGAYAQTPVGARITAVYAGKYAVFMSCADGNVYKLRLNVDGRAEEDSLVSCEVGGVLTAPAEFGNRVYVGSSEGFFVLDGLNMEVEKSFPEMKNASAPFICTGRGQRAYTAVPQMESDGSWYLYSVLDNDGGQTAAEVAKIIDYTGGRSAVSANGTMFFRDAAGRVWAIAESKTDIVLIIVKVAATVGVIVIIILILRAWVRKHSAGKPQY